VPAEKTLLERYAPYRRWVEAGFWIAVFGAQAAFNSGVTVIELRRLGVPHHPWEPVVWEVKSNLVLLLLVPALAWLEARFPLRWDTLRRGLPTHIAASLLYSAMHVAAMLGLRHAVYAALDARYRFGDWVPSLTYEYLKDVRSYALIVATIALYRFFLLRLQGEARLLDAPDEGAPLEPLERPQRFLVHKLRKEFLVAAGDIEWVQAQSNYVGLHVRGHDYLLRTTMAAIEKRLDPARFVRVHRSYIVNLDQVAEIEPLESGDARLLMRDGSRIPCSRSYKERLRAVAA